MTISYRLTPEADNDLVEIWHYTFENRGLQQANKYLGKLENQFLNLADPPGMGMAADETRQGYRIFHHERHLTWYRSKKKNQVEVVRVLHGRMAIDRHF